MHLEEVVLQRDASFWVEWSKVTGRLAGGWSDGSRCSVRWDVGWWLFSGGSKCFCKSTTNEPILTMTRAWCSTLRWHFCSVIDY